jgi:hypothetical protein
MPFVLITIGVVLLVAAVRGTQEDLYYLAAGDFIGKDNFIFWFLSILIIGAIGYIPKMKPISDGFLILVILVLFLKRGQPGVSGGGFFEQFNQAIATTQSATDPVTAQTAAGAGSGSSVNQGIPCIPGTPGCGANGHFGGPGVVPPITIPYGNQL